MTSLASASALLAPGPDLRQHHLQHVVVVQCAGQLLIDFVATQAAQLLVRPRAEVAVRLRLYDDLSGLDELHSRIVVADALELAVTEDFVLASLTAGFELLADTHDICAWAVRPTWSAGCELSFAQLPLQVFFLRRLPLPVTGAELVRLAQSLHDACSLFGLEESGEQPWSLWRRFVRLALASGLESELLELLRSTPAFEENTHDALYALARELLSLPRRSPILSRCRVLLKFLREESGLSEHWQQSLSSWARKHEAVLRERPVN